MQILSTKLFIPPLRPRLVPRSRLIQKLDQGMGCGLVLVSAPAGYGKSTVLSAWLSHLECPAVWYLLDESDNDPLRFLTYLAAALSKVDAAAGEVLSGGLQVDPLPDMEILLIPVANQLALAQQPFWLVFDDFHLIQSPVVHQTVRFLLDHRPAALHLAIATRADPQLPLSRLRARSEMVELRMADLRFTLEETVEFFGDTMGIQIAVDDARRLTERTEGWIAGLQLAALSLQNVQDVSGFVTSFTGSHYPIYDYLLDEILNRQTAEIRRFLLFTCNLDQFSAPLCDALFRGEAVTPAMRPAAVIIDELEHTNLFIIPLDPARRWYRYHPLFADLLRGYLQQSDPQQIAEVHSRASAWFEEQGQAAAAVRQALAAGDWERVLGLISTNVFALLEQNELQSLARQIDHLSGERSHVQPWLWIGRAWLAAYTGQPGPVEEFLQRAEADIDSAELGSDQQALTGHCAAVRAYVAWNQGNDEIAGQYASQALQCLPVNDFLIRCQSATLLGLAQSNMHLRVIYLEQALSYARHISVSHVTIFAYGCWSFALYMQGKQHEAVAACNEAINWVQTGGAGQSLPTLSHIYGTLSLIWLEWNDLEAALRYAQKSLTLAQHWEQADALHFAFTNLAYVMFAMGDIEGAFKNINRALEISRRTSPWFEAITVAQEVRFHLAQSNPDAAEQRLRQANIDIYESPPGGFDMQVRQTRIQIFMAQKQYAMALDEIPAVLDHLEQLVITRYVVHVLICQAVAQAGLGQHAQALKTLRRVLSITAKQGFVRIFCVEARLLVPLLQTARMQGIEPTYVDMLLTAVSQACQGHAGGKTAVPGLVEPLSEREMEVLKLLAQGYSDKEIAGALFIAPETVHKHLKNIYGKLDVHRRTEAVARARELGLLTSTFL
jgi:LuxR family transcriptional regulator, maltose regulon positive regulatory protein